MLWYIALVLTGLLDDLGSATTGAIVLLQASGHNPTGVDPTSQQWEQIRQLMRLKGLLPFFDCAYQVGRWLEVKANLWVVFRALYIKQLIAQSRV